MAELVEQLLQFFILARDLGFGVLLRGDVAAFGKQKHDLAVLVLNGQERKVDGDRLLASGLTVDFHVAAHELAQARSANELPQVVLGLLRDGPPAGPPERFSLNVMQADTRSIERGLVDLKDHAVRVQQAHKLVHLIQHDARELLPVGLEIVGSGERHIADAKYRRVRKQLAVDARHVSPLVRMAGVPGTSGLAGVRNSSVATRFSSRRRRRTPQNLRGARFTGKSDRLPQVSFPLQ